MEATFSEPRKIPLTPDGFVELVFTPDPMQVKLRGRWISLSSTFVIGRLRQTIPLAVQTRCRFVSIRLLGATARLVLEPFGINLFDVTPQAALLPNLRKKLLSRISGNWDSIPILLNDILALSPGRWNPVLPSARAAQLAATAEIRSLAAQLRISRRQFERRVRQASGTSPKALASLARFQRARDFFWTHPQWTLAQIGCAAGYADQAHFTRDFRSFSGMTPRLFRRLVEAQRAGA